MSSKAQTVLWHTTAHHAQCAAAEFFPGHSDAEKSNRFALIYLNLKNLNIKCYRIFLELFPGWSKKEKPKPESCWSKIMHLYCSTLVSQVITVGGLGQVLFFLVFPTGKDFLMSLGQSFGALVGDLTTLLKINYFMNELKTRRWALETDLSSCNNHCPRSGPRMKGTSIIPRKPALLVNQKKYHSSLFDVLYVPENKLCSFSTLPPTKC